MFSRSTSGSYFFDSGTIICVKVPRYVLNSGKDNADSKKDPFINDYGAPIRESSLLATCTGILFGFLLEISITAPDDFSLINRITLLAALFSITVAISLFIRPVIYHHLQFPYEGGLEKFAERSHRFIMFGLIPAGISLYLGLEIALSSILFEFAFAVAATPFVMIFFLFRMRKQPKPRV